MAAAGVGRRLLEAGVSVGLAASGMRGPFKGWRQAALRDIFSRGASLRLQFPKEDLGFVYGGVDCSVLPDISMSAAEWGAPPSTERSGKHFFADAVSTSIQLPLSFLCCRQ